MRKVPILYIVIPCYNEEEVLPITAPLFLKKIHQLVNEGKILDESRILFINDGSKDGTWELIKKLSKEEYHYKGIAQSRNRGHQNAVLAGLMTAKEVADITISIDCDGQDDINAMVDAYMAGAEVVYGVRSKRETDTFFKRFTAESFYHLLNWMGAEVVFNHADYRLISSKVLNAFSDFKEVNIFLRGLIPLVGFNSTSVYYERHERIAGESHYPLKKMLALAFNGISSFSVKPISMILGAGVIIVILSILAAIYALISYCTGHVVPGWTSLILSIWFLGGIQLMAVGLVGQYIGKIYIEVKHRPRYNIEKVLK